MRTFFETLYSGCTVTDILPLLYQAIQTRKTVVGINQRQMYAVMPVWLLRTAGNAWFMACRTVTISQSLFATRFAKYFLIVVF